MEEKKSKGVELVLNGGKMEMDSATIPVQWFFSDEVIAKKPVYLLIFEQTKRETKNDFDSGKSGRRYACRVSDGTKFIQLFAPGYHRMMVLVFAEKDGSKTVRDSLLGCASPNYHDAFISWAKAADGSLVKEWGQYGLLATAIVSFVVPEALFAKKPETRFQKTIWKWANLWYKKSPRDECEYRKRKILAFTLKPVAWLVSVVATVIVTILYRLLATIYIVLGNSFVFFFGFRPSPFREDMAQLWGGQGADWDRTRYGEHSYKIWLSWRDNYEISKQKNTVRMFIAPWEVCAIAASALGIFYFLAEFWKELIATFVVGVGGTVLVIYAVNYSFKAVKWYLDKLPGESEEEKRKKALKKENREREKEKEAEKRKYEKLVRAAEIQRQREEQYQSWLARNYSVDRKPEKVDLVHLPAPLAKTERVAQVFRVSFWALKARVCKPYSK